MYPAYITDEVLDELIGRVLAEDVGAGDVTTLATVAPDIRAEGHFLAKEAGAVAGLVVAERVFRVVDETLQVTWALEDGAAVQPGMHCGTVQGRARSILTAERLALNLMQRMSGIATFTRRMVEAVRPHRARLLDTRKTAPGLRLLDKWAVRLGGGDNHRLGLFDMILIKDNHLAAAGGVRRALQAAQQYRTTSGRNVQIEIEARTLDEVRAVLEAGGTDMILLDNMVDVHADGTVDTARLEEAIALVDGRLPTEASGNVTLETVQAIAATGVDFISCGALTHSVKALDLSLNILLTRPEKG